MLTQSLHSKSHAVSKVYPEKPLVSQTINHVLHTVSVTDRSYSVTPTHLPLQPIKVLLQPPLRVGVLLEVEVELRRRRRRVLVVARECLDASLYNRREASETNTEFLFRRSKNIKDWIYSKELQAFLP